MIYWASEYFIPTLKETPAEAEIVSHQLMLRAGLIQQVSLGMYIWLPLGLRVVRRIENVVREEMQRIGCNELLMPGVQPASLWQLSGRWDDYGRELLRFSDRHEREYCLGPTHEEVITSMVKSRVQSYQDLPLSLFQIQTKFRDEIRPRFGVMRSREFVMKDAYSFHVDQADLQRTYDQMERAYHAIFQRLGLTYRAVAADSGTIGGAVSREFHVLTPSGEDLLVTSSESDYAANIETVACSSTPQPPQTGQSVQKLHTPDCETIEQLQKAAGCTPDECLKLLLVHHRESTENKPKLVALALRGGDMLNTVKAEKLPELAVPLRFAEEAHLRTCGLVKGYIGPCDIPCDIIADNAAVGMGDFVCGANQKGIHLSGVNWGRDCAYARSADIRNIREGEPSPDGKGTVVFTRGSEVGHIFQLGDKYSRSMNLTVVDKASDGKPGETITPLMGCYGIGITRIVATHIEQSHDDNGIIWNAQLAPFDVHLLLLSTSEKVTEAAKGIADELGKAGYVAFVDNRALRPGVLFSQADLIGIPWQIVVSERNLANNQLEIRHRAGGAKHMIEPGQLVAFLRAQQQ